MVNLSSSFNGEEDDHQDPSCTNGGGHDDDDNDDLTLNEERMRMRDKRLFLLKIDYLRECHIIHSRKATKKYSLREVSLYYFYIHSSTIRYLSLTIVDYTA